MIRILPALIFSLLAASLVAQAPITYRITLTAGNTRDLKVEVGLPADLPDEIELSLERWTPWIYAKLDEPRRITRVNGSIDGGGSLRVQRDGLLAWKLSGKGDRKATLSYTVEIPPTPFDGRHYIHEEGALLLAERSFVRVKGAEGRAHELTWVLPEGWKTASTLEPVAEGTWRAADRAALLDAPVIVGKWLEKRIVAGNLAVQLVIDRRGSSGITDLDGLARQLKSALEQMVKGLGPLPFAEHLLILVEDSQRRSFHSRTAVVGIAAGTLESPAPPLLVMATEGVVASATSVHFHPEGFGPRDPVEPPRSPSLWAAEGIPAWLARLYVVRAGLAPISQWCGELADRLLQHRNHLLADRVAAAQSSKRAWPREAETTGSLEDSISFKLQGHLLAGLLDMKLRAANAGEKGLEAVLQAGWKAFGTEKGYAPADLVKLVSEVAGKDQKAFFDTLVDAPGPLPWEESFTDSGLMIEWSKWRVQDPKVRFEPGADGRLRVRGLADDDDFYIAGLRNGDTVEEVNQTRVRHPHEIDRIVGRMKPGMKLRVDIRRNDRRRSVRLQLKPAVAVEVPAEERNGLIVIERIPPGPLEAAGLVAGDVLEKIDNRRITQVGDIAEALLRVRRNRALFTIKRSGRRKRISVKAPPRITWRATLSEDPKAKGPAAAVFKSLFDRR